ncbi:hypothetical protein [Levilactobacillus mulengensis]|uniref:hypothetical protein n=1 Tax=Levilactobacillus mulengensis TaxID=2486025 RepID=UPI000F76DA6E|nr:hypothetical protein [Levilactobacillus mulengensis]
MKFTNMMGALLASVSFGAVLAVANPTVDAQASAKMSLASAPKKFQGTWYYYQNGHYDRYTIAAKKTSYRNFNGKKWVTGYSPIKVANLNKNMRNIKTGKHNTLLFMSKGWLLDEEWANHTKASAMGTPGTEGYKIVSRHYKGKTIKSLYTNAMWNVGNGEVHLQHYYKTKGQAKAFNPTGASEDFTD